MSRTAASRSDSEAFYRAVLMVMNDSGVEFLVGGTCAVNEYIGLGRPTKDLDVFCRAGDYPKLLSACNQANFQIEVEDERWIAKICKGDDFCDVVFGSANMVAPVTDDWFAEEFDCKIYGVPVRLLAPTELVWSKVFIMDRYKFDGNDVAHIILQKHKAIDWRRLMMHHEQHWEVLLLHLLRFRYIYPSEREIVPGWVLDELLGRLALQLEMPVPLVKACRGRMFSRDDFLIDIAEWGYADAVGAMGEVVSRQQEQRQRAEEKSDRATDGAPPPAERRRARRR